MNTNIEVLSEVNLIKIVLIDRNIVLVAFGTPYFLIKIFSGTLTESRIEEVRRKEKEITVKVNKVIIVIILEANKILATVGEIEKTI